MASRSWSGPDELHASDVVVLVEGIVLVQPHREALRVRDLRGVAAGQGGAVLTWRMREKQVRIKTKSTPLTFRSVVKSCDISGVKNEDQDYYKCLESLTHFLQKQQLVLHY